MGSGQHEHVHWKNGRSDSAGSLYPVSDLDGHGSKTGQKQRRRGRSGDHEGLAVLIVYSGRDRQEENL